MGANEISRNSIFRELYVSIGLTFAYFTGFNMLSPILPLYIVDVGASKFELGILMSILPGITILTRLPFGFITDRFGRWLTLLMSLSMQLIAYLLYAIAPSYIFLYPIAALYALSLASFGPISIAIALDSASMDRRGSAMGRYYASIGASMIVGPLLTGFLALHLNYRQILFLASLLPLFSIFSLVIAHLKRNVIKFSRKDLSASRLELMPFKSIVRILRLRNVLAICLAQIAFFIATGAFDTLFPIYAKESLWLATSTISIFFATRGLPNALVRIPMGSLSDRIGRCKPLIFSYSLAFLALFLIPNVSNILVIALLMGIYGAAWGSRTAPTAAFIGDNVKSSDINLASALIWLTADIGLTLGSLIAGSATLILKIPTVLKITSISVLPGILILLFIKERVV